VEEGAAEQPLAAAADSPASVDCSHDWLLCSSTAVNATDGLLTVYTDENVCYLNQQIRIGLLTDDDGRIDQSNFDDNPGIGAGRIDQATFVRCDGQIDQSSPDDDPGTGAGRMDQATFVRCDGRMDQSIGEASVD